MNRIGFKIGFAGEFRCILRDLMGRAVYETDWSSNTILDTGLPVYGSLNPFSYAAIGFNGTATDVSQTGLLSWQGDNNSYVGSDNPTFSGGPAYSHSNERGYRFNAGNATGLIQEMSIAASTNNNNVWSRHVISPGINKTVDNVLDVYYRSTIYPPLGDSVGQVTLGGVVYDTLSRAADLDQVAVNSAFGGPSQWNPGWGSSGFRVYDGNIGATITDVPTGNTTTDVGTKGNATYTAPNLYRDATVDGGLDDANIVGPPGGIRSILWPFSGFQVQCQFTAAVGEPTAGGPIPKDATNIYGLVCRQSWGRYT